MKATAEQDNAITLARTGGSVKINAKAGAGKSSTLRLIAADQPNSRFTYLVFNKALAVEAQEKFPKNVACSTAHSLAFRSYAAPNGFAKRLGGATVPVAQQARMIGTDPFIVTVDGAARRLAATFVAAAAMKAIDRFCLTGDAAPGWYHVPPVDALGDARSDANMAFRRHVAEYLPRIWADLLNPTGRLTYSHNAYLKAWALTDPAINTDCILYDEAQDANGAMLSIVEAQQARGTQVILVGDPYQAIYEWNGAVDAMTKAHADHEAHLTMSFRFGQEIADAANVVLANLGDTHPIVGNPAIRSQVRDIAAPFVTLCRTNAAAVSGALGDLKRGGKPYIVGGVADVIAFVKAAIAVQNGQETMHPKLAAFSSWGEVTEHAEETGDGDLTRLIRLMDQFGPETLVSALQALPTKDTGATSIYSTAHKAKGREWAEVAIAQDFPSAEPETDVETGKTPRAATVEEQRLLYVAATRAQKVLDTGGHPDLMVPAPAAA